MSTLAGALGAYSEDKPTPAPKTATIEPGDFASDWRNRPTQAFDVGLRLPSEDDVQIARTGADQALAALALNDNENAIDAWNDLLMARAVARCICNPLNVREDSPVFPLPEDTISQALTSRAIRRLFDEVERLTVEQSPLAPEATDEELVTLADAILSGEPLGLATADERSFRRFAHYCLDFLPND